jgi:hypothetical protein
MRIALAAALIPPLLLLLLAGAPCAKGSAAVHSGRHGSQRRLHQTPDAGSGAAVAARHGESSLSPRSWPVPAGYL